MKRYRLAGPAKADLDEIWLYIAQEGGVEAADRVIGTITARFHVLGECRTPDEHAMKSDRTSELFPSGNI